MELDELQLIQKYSSENIRYMKECLTDNSSKAIQFSVNQMDTINKFLLDFTSKFTLNLIPYVVISEIVSLEVFSKEEELLESV